MNKKLTDIISIIRNNRYNSYNDAQKNSPVSLIPKVSKYKFTKLFNDLLQLGKHIKHVRPIGNKKHVERTINNKIAQTQIVPPVIKKTVRIISKFTNNALFNVLIKQFDFYMIKVRKTHYDFYSEIFMKALDKLYCLLPKEESLNYLKKIKYNVIDEFNKKHFYKLYNYSPKHFKKSELDDIFGNNKLVRFNMLKVFADVFNCNLIYLENSSIKFITKFVDNSAVVILTEDDGHVYCLRTKDKRGYIRSSNLKKVLGVDIKLYPEKLTKTPLSELQNLSRMKNIDYKKQGKTKKINKTREELIDELCRL